MLSDYRYAWKQRRHGDDLQAGFYDPTCVAYLGGGQDDFADAILAHSDGSFTVAGSTWSQNFPVTSGVWQEHATGGMSLFLSRIRPQTGLPSQSVNWAP